MFQLLIRRLLYAIPIILGTTALLFVVFNIVPGDPVYQIAGRHATPEIIASIRAEFGLDQPLWRQYIHLLEQLLTFDFGRSYATKEKITDMILNGAGASFSLVAPPFFIAMLLSLFGALVLALYRGSWIDKTVVALCVAGQSVSVLVYILAGQYFLAYKWGFFPISGYDPTMLGRWPYLVLPGMIYILLSLAPEIRFYRTLVLDEIYQDYVRTARSKGLDNSQVLFKHVLKNVMIPVITNLVIHIPFLILGALLLESFFGIPGLGDLIVRAIQNADRPVIIATTILGTLAYVIFNTISDLLYACVDPRVSMK